MDTCIFCQIVSGESPSHTVWENDTHLAFLSIFPNTEGVTVVIPKAHLSSYIFDQSQEDITAIMQAAKTVAHKIDAAFDDVGRTGVVFEGFGVNHLHAKLFPLHGTADENWKQRNSTITTYTETYPGYISSHDAGRADDQQLAQTAQRIQASR